MVPDYFHYLLTGEKAVEYTNATTTQLVHVETGEWDWELIEKCGFPKRIFPKIKQPGEPLGELRKEIQQEVGFNTKVVLAATHDTGSAVAATPCQGEPGLYISSGTWSLMGTEISRAVCTEEAQRNNFTNEGGYEHRFRFLKNIMGLWMIQCIRHEEHDVYSFADLCRMAEECDNFPSRVDVNDERFLAPSGMKEEIQVYCSETGQSIPQSTGEIASVIYHSLADSYAETAVEIERILGKKYEHIHIIGGGANADYMSRLTARASGRTVYAGPTEATATGNLIIQMINAGVFKDLEKARECVSNSFPVKEFKPD